MLYTLRLWITCAWLTACQWVSMAWNAEDLNNDGFFTQYMGLTAAKHHGFPLPLSEYDRVLLREIEAAAETLKFERIKASGTVKGRLELLEQVSSVSDNTMILMDDYLANKHETILQTGMTDDGYFYAEEVPKPVPKFIEERDIPPSSLFALDELVSDRLNQRINEKIPSFVIE